MHSDTSVTELGHRHVSVLKVAPVTMRGQVLEGVLCALMSVRASGQLARACAGVLVLWCNG